MKFRKLTAAMLLATVVATAGTAMAATVPGAVYSDQQAAGVNKPIQQVQQDLQKAGVQDVKPTDWFAGSVTVLLQAGLMAPAADGSFKPEAQVNAAEGVAVFAKVLGIASKTDTPEQALAKAQQAGIAREGLTGATALRRSEVAVLIATALGVQPKVVSSPADYPFADYETTSPEDRAILAALYELGIFKGYLVDGVRTFRPDGVLTRAEIAILVDRILGAQ
jgi:hypothetical protein